MRGMRKLAAVKGQLWVDHCCSNDNHNGTTACIPSALLRAVTYSCTSRMRSLRLALLRRACCCLHASSESQVSRTRQLQACKHPIMITAPPPTCAAIAALRCAVQRHICRPLPAKYTRTSTQAICSM
jgi:hypothetical protein